MWWGARERKRERGERKKRSNYLLKDVFWLPILTRLYIDYIHFPVTLDRLTSQQASCSECRQITLLNDSIQLEIHVILTGETAVKHSSTANVTMLNGQHHFENVKNCTFEQGVFFLMCTFPTSVQRICSYISYSHTWVSCFSS